MTQDYYAHSLPGTPQEEWQRLEEHLRNVAEMARQFADSFGAGERGHVAGLWHDLGSYSEELQTRLAVLSETERTHA
jgi:CRISPR-associated endonuclease/helicase Cas3